MATIEFPYGEFKGRYYPLIKVHIKNKDIEKDSDALIDSGAIISMFRPEIAESLGIKIEDGERRMSVGISGKIEVFIHQIELKVLDRWFSCKVAFSRQNIT